MNEYDKVSINVDKKDPRSDDEVIDAYEQQVLSTFKWVGRIPLAVSVNRTENLEEATTTIGTFERSRTYQLDYIEPSREPSHIEEIPLFDYCLRCGRPLTSESSRIVGYGPTCYQKEFGGP